MKYLQKFTAALAFSLSLVATAQATGINLNPGDTWNEFTVDDLSSASSGTEWIMADDSNSPDFGSPLHFTFTVPQGFIGLLSVVDSGFAGDRFEIFNHGSSLGVTSSTNNSSDFSVDFSESWNNPNFSRAYFNLMSGSYDITGRLFSSLQNFTATNGALKFEAVGETKMPEPSAMVLLFVGLGLIALARLRA